MNYLSNDRMRFLDDTFHRQAAEIAKIAEPLAALRSLIAQAPDLKSFATQYDETRRALMPLAATVDESSQALRRAAEQLARESGQLTDYVRRNVGEWRRIQELLTEPAANMAIQSLANRDSWLRQLSESRSALNASLGPDLFKTSWDLGEAIASNLAAIRAGLIAPRSGFLLGDSSAGLLSWADEHSHRMNMFSSAVLPHHGARESDRQLIRVECTVRCRFCDEALIVDGDDRSIDESGNLIVTLRLVPLCRACLRSNQDDPAYFEQQLSRLVNGDEPEFRLIRGSGEGDGVAQARGILRLVENDPSPEQDDSDS